MAKTYEPIATTTASGSQSTITFSSISSAYTDLYLVASANAVNNLDYLCIQLNGDTSTNYSNTQLYGTGSTASSTRSSNSNRLLLTTLPVSSSPTIALCNIMNYSNATTYKSILVRTSYSAGQVDAFACLWRSTSSITSITVFTNGGNNFSSSSIFTLYGIKAA